MRTGEGILIGALFCLTNHETSSPGHEPISFGNDARSARGFPYTPKSLVSGVRQWTIPSSGPGNAKTPPIKHPDDQDRTVHVPTLSIRIQTVGWPDIFSASIILFKHGAIAPRADVNWHKWPNSNWKTLGSPASTRSRKRTSLSGDP